MKKYLIILSLICYVNTLKGTSFEVSYNGESYSPLFIENENTALTIPEEGQWSVALDWNKDWPDQWVHAFADSIEMVGEWTILHGKITLPEGELLLRDAFRPEENRVKCVRRYQWTGKTTLNHVTLSARWVTPVFSDRVFMPGILYYGNPSGYRNGQNMPTFNQKEVPEAIFEEHRFSMPFVSVAYEQDKQAYTAAVHSLPSSVPFGNIPDQWWSFGVKAHNRQTEICLLSGPVVWNKKRSYAKARQKNKDAIQYNHAFLNIEPGGIVEKTFFIEIAQCENQGAGFISPINTSMEIFKPFYVDDMPSFQQIIKDKYRFAESRYIEYDKVAGFSMYPIKDRKRFVFGWCGQAASLGFAMQNLSQFVEDPKLNDKIQKSLDFLTNAPFNENGFYLIYDVDKGDWSGQDFLSQGQGMYNFAKAIQTAKKNKHFTTSKWEVFFQKACDLHSKRVLQKSWNPISTNEGFLAAPLAIAYSLYNKQQYLQAAAKIADHYIERHMSMVEPYWGGTLDATGEDKEGAWAAFQAFLSMYEITNDAKYLKAAEHAAYVTLSYTVVWDIPMPPSRLANHFFKTRGWTTVSPQNMHIDVYGVNYAPWLYKLGMYLNRESLKKISLLMYRSCGQIIDPYGSHGEQLQQTNFAQYGDMSDIYKFRGGYAENWTVFWITAHFLNAAAHFMEIDPNIIY